MKGVSSTIKVTLGMVLLLVAAAIIVSIVTGQNQNLVDFGTGTISGTLNNTTG